MADINLDKGKTMLLMADFSTSGIGQNPVAKERHTLERAMEVLAAARNAGVFIGYCINFGTGRRGGKLWQSAHLRKVNTSPPNLASWWSREVRQRKSLPVAARFSRWSSARWY